MDRGAIGGEVGEAKRRRQAIEEGPCPCGSMRPGNTCCYGNGVWFKPPANLSLRNLPAGEALERCYLRELQSCAGGMSAEHLVSRGVVRELARGGDFSVSGLPWLEPGETRILSSDGITAKCLCQKHNNALSPLDDAAIHFFSTLTKCFDSEDQQVRSIVSGHDIERWLLKTLRAFAVSKNLSQGGERLPGQFKTEEQFVEMLDDPLSWPDGAGIYCTMKPGDVTTNHARFRLQPLSDQRGDIVGVTVDMMGIVFVLRLDVPEGVRPDEAMYRPSTVVILFSKVTHFVFLSWADSVRSGGQIRMEHTGRVPPTQSQSTAWLRHQTTTRGTEPGW